MHWSVSVEGPQRASYPISLSSPHFFHSKPASESARFCLNASVEMSSLLHKQFAPVTGQL